MTLTATTPGPGQKSGHQVSLASLPPLRHSQSHINSASDNSQICLLLLCPLPLMWDWAIIYHIASHLLLMPLCFQDLAHAWCRAGCQSIRITLHCMQPTCWLGLKLTPCGWSEIIGSSRSPVENVSCWHLGKPGIKMPNRLSKPSPR